MDPVLRLSFAFGLGLLVQAVFLIKHDFRKNLGKFLKVIMLSLFIPALISFIYLTDGNSAQVDPYVLLFWLYLVFIAAFSATFFYEILYEIDERFIFIWNIIFWYGYSLRFDLFSWTSVIFIVPTFVVLVNAFVPAYVDYFWKIVLYAWFLIILVFLTIVQISASDFQFILNPPKIASLKNLGSVFLAGMVFFYLINYLMHLAVFLPIKSKHERWADRFEHMRRHAITLSAKYSDHQMRFKEALIILAVFGGILIVNYHFKFLSAFFLINIGIIGSFAYAEMMRKK